MAWTSGDTLKLLRTLAPYASEFIAIESRLKTIRARRVTIINRHATYGAFGTVDDVDSVLAQYEASLRQSLITLREQARRIIFDADLVTSKLPVPPNAFNETEILNSLIASMGAIDGPQTLSVIAKLAQAGDTTYNLSTAAGVDAVAIPFVDYGDAATNAAGTQLILTSRLDGVTPPSASTQSSLTNYNTRTQAVYPDETIVLEVVTDSVFGGRNPGDELFRFYSRGAKDSFLEAVPSSGSVNNVPTAKSTSIGLLEPTTSFPTTAVAADALPASWDDGDSTEVIGTDYTYDESTGVYPGVGSFNLPAGSLDLRLYFPFSLANVVRNRLYCLYWWERHSGEVEPGLNIVRISTPSHEAGTPVGNTDSAFGDPIYTSPVPSSSDDWALRFALYYGNPQNSTENGTGKIRIGMTAVTNAAIEIDDATSVEISGIGIAPIEYYAGLGYLLVPGSTNPVASVTGVSIGDFLELQLQQQTIDAEVYDTNKVRYVGHWSKFFRQILGRQVKVDSPATAGNANYNPAYDQVLFSDATGGESLTSVPT